MNLKKVVEQAIEALQSARSVFNGEHDTCGGCAWCDAPSYGPCEPHCDKDKAVKALRAALAEDVPESNFGSMAQVFDCYGDGNVYHINGMPAVEGPLSKAQRTCQESRQVEPVAWRYIPSERLRDAVLTSDPSQARLAADYGCEVQPLYPAPPKREPLTDAELYALGAESNEDIAFVRRVLAAHGIGGEE